MAYTYKTDQFAATSGSQEVDTGTGVELKALILFSTLLTADGYAANMSGFLGWAVSSTARKHVSLASDDNVATTVTGGSLNNTVIRLEANGIPTVDAIADFTSFGTGANAGKFTINWSDAPAAASLISYIALGGTDITNAFVGQFTAPNAVTGNRDDTGVGFQPDIVLFLNRGNVTALGAAAQSRIGVGAAKSATAEGCMWASDRDNRTAAAHAKHYQNNVACLAIPSVNGDATFSLADFVAFTTDGWTLNWSIAGAAAPIYFALALKGGQYDVDEISCPASTGAQAISTGFNMANGGVFFFGTGMTTANATIADESHLALGGGGGASILEQHVWLGSDNTINTDANSRRVATKCVGGSTNPSTISSEADYSSNDSAGYTIGWTTVLSTAKFFGVAFGATAAGLTTEYVAPVGEMVSSGGMIGRKYI